MASNIKFEKILDPIAYVRPDQEPVEILQSIFPFKKIDDYSQYKYDSILGCLSPYGFKYIFPLLVNFFTSYSNRLDSNLFDTFEYLIQSEDFSQKVIYQWLALLEKEEFSLIKLQVNQLLNMDGIECKTTNVLKSWISDKGVI